MVCGWTASRGCRPPARPSRACAGQTALFFMGDRRYLAQTPAVLCSGEDPDSNDSFLDFFWSRPLEREGSNSVILKAALLKVARGMELVFDDEAARSILTLRSEFLESASSSDRGGYCCYSEAFHQQIRLAPGRGLGVHPEPRREPAPLRPLATPTRVHHSAGAAGGRARRRRSGRLTEKQLDDVAFIWINVPMWAEISKSLDGSEAPAVPAERHAAAPPAAETVASGSSEADHLATASSAADAALATRVPAAGSEVPAASSVRSCSPGRLEQPAAPPLAPEVTPQE
ncbi:unnamed protein product, partial [Prorocentrum cordatum]